MSAIDALYIFDRYAPTPTIILQHEWRSRIPASPTTLYSHFTALPEPRPSLVYIPTTSPPTLLFNIAHSNLLLFSPTTSEIEPLLVLEFLHRVVDVLEDYLGSPLIASKIEGSYDIVAQLLNEMADDGFPFTTEPNALKDVVYPPSLMGKLFGSVTGLPSNTLPHPQASTISAIPWRRSNVKHTSNEMYVDMIETITATVAPSGRPLAARANGTIAFTSKLSGTPDLLVTLHSPTSHKQRLGAAPNSFLQYPVFHQCVRLAHWKKTPGELSFVPPDGKFVLASYEVDLLGPHNFTTKNAPQLTLPVAVEMATNLGTDNTEFEVRVFITTSALPPSSNASSSSSASLGNGGGTFGSRTGTRSPALTAGGTTSSPIVEEISIKIPLPASVKTLTSTRCSKGEFHHENREIIWRIPHTGAAGGTATFRTGIQVRTDDDDDNSSSSDDEMSEGEVDEAEQKRKDAEKERARRKRVQAGMPRCALVAFSVKGWLASGVKVESIRIVGGKGMGENVKPYKGVKYITRGEGVEVRC